MIRLATLVVLMLLALSVFVPITTQAEVVGDTLHLGQTWFDNPQPFSSKQLLALTRNHLDEDSLMQILWFRQDSASGDPIPQMSEFRFSANDAQWNRFGNPVYITDMPTMGGGLVQNPMHAGSMPLLVHDLEWNPEGFRPWFYVESSFISGFYDWMLFDYSSLENVNLGQPHGVSGSNEFVHTSMSTWYDDSLETVEHYYLRGFVDSAENYLVQDRFVEISNSGRHPSADIAVSEDGSHVAMTMLMPRDDETGDFDGIKRSNNDLYLFESFDSGATWNTGSPLNITNWIPPDPSLLPDTSRANGDTLRCVRDAELFIDEFDIVHVFFTVAGMDYYRQKTSAASRIYHWDSRTSYFVQVADGSSLPGRPDETGYSVDSPQFVLDPFSMVGYLLFRRVSTFDAPFDTANGFSCSDLYMTMSPFSEDVPLLRWTMPINITRTNWNSETPMQPGDAHSENHASIMMDEHDNFQISYLVDRWPGLASDSSGTMNDAVLQTVSTSDIGDLFWETWGSPHWWFHIQPLENFPMHVDSTGWYPLDWLEVEEDPTQPMDFVLLPASPNPFNPSTRISFTLSTQERAKLTVYDVLGREVAVLLDRAMMAGEHTVAFSGADLPSGMYFCKLQIADQVRMQKMVLMK